MDSSTITLRPPVWALFIAVAIGGSFYLAGKHIESRGPINMPPTISVMADAKVSAPPDIATLSFGVTTGRQPTAKAATTKLTDTMNKIIAAVKAAGVAEKDIKTESFYLNPEYDYTTNGQIPRGFQASESLTVKVRDLDKAGDVLTAATNAGANQAGSVNFTIDNPDTLKAQAREQAIAKAKAKALVLASDLGMRLGRLTGFSEDGAYRPPVMMLEKANYGMGGGGMDIAAPSVPLPSGEQDIVSNVTLVYELK